MEVEPAYSFVPELLTLIKEWTRAEIMARHGPLINKGDICYAHIKIEKEDEIRKLLYSTDDTVELGLEWGLLKPTDKKGQKT